MAEPGFEPVLPERLWCQGRGEGAGAAYQGDCETSAGQGSADADHALIEGQVVGNGEKKFLVHKPVRGLPASVGG